MEGSVLQVAIPIFNNVTALDFVGPYEMLQVLPNVTVVFVSHSKGLYTADGGVLSFEARATFEEVPHPDIVLVPGGFGTKDLMNDERLLNWLRKAHETSIYTTSVCTGSLLLGAAGLLKGLDATTHWSAMDILAKHGATPIRDKRVVHQGKIITSAGVSSGIDMSLELVEMLSNEKFAKVVQLLMEYDPQPPHNTGSVSKAGPEILSEALECVQAAGIKWD